MVRIMETLTAVLVTSLIIMLIIILIMTVCVEIRKQVKPNVYDVYSKALNECTDDSCRRYVNIFYLQLVRDLNKLEGN